ncbi:MAG: hypothetical protein ABI647_15790 [Gemmatimonadota bacterium]
MVGPVGRSSPVELIRASSDQVRRAAAVIAQISEDIGPSSGSEAGQVAPASGSSSEDLASSMVTIMIAQRLVAAAVRVERTIIAMDEEVVNMVAHSGGQETG